MINISNKLGATKVQEPTRDEDMEALADFMREQGTDPHQVMVCCALLAGFDLCILKESDGDANVTGMMMGKPEYINRVLKSELEDHDHFKHPANHEGLTEDDLPSRD